MLTPHQLTYFKTFGFVPLRGIFSPDEIKTFNDEFQLKLETTLRYTATKDEPIKYCSWSNLGNETPHLAALIDDPRIVSIAEQLLGNDCAGLSCNSGSFINNTAWHPDCRNFNAQDIKFPIYLQPLDEETGALRFIPGSHKKPFHDEIIKFGPSGFKDQNTPEGKRAIKDTPAYICKTEPGDAFVFDCHLWHASWGGISGITDRRLVTLIYEKNPTTPDEEQAIRGEVKINYDTRANLAKNTYNNPPPEYPPEWLANPGNDPRRQRWIDYLHKWRYIEIFHDATAS